MALKTWSTGFPTALDTTTQMPTLVNATDVTDVSQLHAVRDAVIALEAASGKTSSPAAGSHRARLSTLEAQTTKGDLLGHDGSALGRLGVGTDGQVLTADAASTYGAKWAAAAAHGAVLLYAYEGYGLEPFSEAGTSLVTVKTFRLPMDAAAPWTGFRVAITLWHDTATSADALIQVGGSDHVDLTSTATSETIVWGDITWTGATTDALLTAILQLKRTGGSGVVYSGAIWLYGIR